MGRIVGKVRIFLQKHKLPSSISFIFCLQISGREVFQFRPELVADDADDEEESFDITQYRRDEVICDCLRISCSSVNGFASKVPTYTVCLFLG
jgi:hypothetical protein